MLRATEVIEQRRTSKTVGQIFQSVAGRDLARIESPSYGNRGIVAHCRGLCGGLLAVIIDDALRVRVKKMFIASALCFCCATVMAADLSKNPVGVPWVDTTDEWGRPWCDAASDFYKRLDVQRKSLASQGIATDQIQFAVGTELSLQKVFRPKLWFKGDMSGSVTIEAARGEVEAFQLVVCPIADAERTLTKLSDETEQANGTFQPKSVTIRALDVSPLQHDASGYEIDPRHVQLYRVGYIRTVPSQYPVMHVGDWPDPLLPVEPFEVANPHCQPIWVEVKVPRDAPAGDYRGRVTVMGPHEVCVEVKLTVWDFALPDPPPMFSMGWAFHDWLSKDGIDVLLKRLDVLLDHRLAPWHAAFPHRANT